MHVANYASRSTRVYETTINGQSGLTMDPACYSCNWRLYSLKFYVQGLEGINDTIERPQTQEWQIPFKAIQIKTYLI